MKVDHIETSSALGIFTHQVIHVYEGNHQRNTETRSDRARYMSCFFTAGVGVLEASLQLVQAETVLFKVICMRKRDVFAL